ncbi:cytochrome P450 [Ceratobasidium sp. AG-I]|nr:cytochrome P450 [Ceratobasidium sp. AG-I]
MASLSGRDSLVASALIFISVALWARNNRRKLPLPPGPPEASWFSGHTPLIPKPGDKQTFWQAFTEWAKTYGDVMHLRLNGQHIIVLSSYEAVSELFEKRGALYSDRSKRRLGDMLGWGKGMNFAQYDDRWRQYRRLSTKGFSKPAAARYHSGQAKEVHMCIQRILENPEAFQQELKRMAGAIIMRVVYGYSIQAASDPYIVIADNALRTLSVTTGLSAPHIVDSFPFISLLPAWLPGMGWKRYILSERHWTNDMSEKPWQWTRNELAKGTAEPSLVSHLLEDNKSGADGEDVIKWLAATAYAAGTHTTSGVLSNFIMAMILNPHIAKRAREELDRVIGTERLPGMEDREKLVYVDCVVLESMRWRNVLPLAVPHRIAVEDEYKGYRIPAGSTVVSNLNAIANDEETFPNASQFTPERFLDPSKPYLALSDTILDPRSFVFGIGRRVCPGIHLADASLFLTIACMIATMNFGPVDGGDGVLDVGFVPGLVAVPLSFKCSIEPRSQAAKQLVNDTVHSEQD